jgi:hypothetical protein
MNEKEVVELTLRSMEATYAALYAAYLATADFGFLTARKYLSEFKSEIEQLYGKEKYNETRG